MSDNQAGSEKPAAGSGQTVAGSGQQDVKAAEAKPADAKPADDAQAETNTVDLIATGSFFEQPDMQGKLLQAGDKLTTDRIRAAELRAGGLVTYADEKMEKEAAAEDAPPSTENGKPVITTRSIRRRGASTVVALLLALGLAGPAFAQTQGTQRPTLFAIDSGTKTATATSGAATLNKSSGVITSEALTTIAGATYVLTLTDSNIAAADQVFASVWLGTSTTGTATVAMVKPQAGSVVITIQNIAAAAVFNGTIKVAFAVLKN
jgi:hypothetical protein